ncbi:MAG: DUF3524 domain-containing protein [Planctomycetes bacterium]|nr:DUF3524 domain-containing protein [Planctomycetota bacterium]
MVETRNTLRIVGFEPYDDGSHRAVRESISRHSKHDWTWLTRPGRAWKWRMRLAAPEMVDQALEGGVFDRPVDAIFATSLLGLSDLRGLLAKVGIASVPFVLYLHENQAAYPEGFTTTESKDRDLHFALTNLTGILSADLAIFNSEWNRRSFLAGIDRILKLAPDLTLNRVRERIEAASIVIWPPVEPYELAEAEAASPRVFHNSVKVVWPHRWEHDKGPDELLEIAEQFTESHNLRWTILGERFREVPAALKTFESRFAAHIDHIGFIEDHDEYRRHLASCDWVLSTAKHEFFGIAVVEAMLAGCLPWLPDRLSYPELLPEVIRGGRGVSPMNPPDDPEALHKAIQTHLQPALAPNAIASLDQAIAQLAASHL